MSQIFYDGKLVKSCVIYRTKKQYFGPLSNCRYRADLARNMSWPAPNIWLTMFQISSKSVHFQRSYSRTREGRSFDPLSICNIRPNCGRIIRTEQSCRPDGNFNCCNNVVLEEIYTWSVGWYFLLSLCIFTKFQALNFTTSKDRKGSKIYKKNIAMGHWRSLETVLLDTSWILVNCHIAGLTTSPSCIMTEI